MATAGSIRVRCPHCDAENPPGERTCWLCREAIASACGDEVSSKDFVRPSSGRADTNTWTFHLSSLMIVIAIIAIFLGLLREVPGLSILLVIVATPAVVRTCVATSRRRAKGAPMTRVERLWAFAGSVGVVAVTGAASTAAFSAICFGSAFLGAAATSGQRGSYPGLAGLIWGAMIGGGLGFIIAVYVFYRFVRWLWPIKDKS